MAQFNINNYNKDKYTEISFTDGLKYIKENDGVNLYSDGLEFSEYIIFVKDHYEYEDGCYLGCDSVEIIERTGFVGSWIPSHKFYIENKTESEE